MKRASLAAAGILAGAFVAGFVARTLYAFRDVVRTMDRQDAELTRQFIRDELKDELRRKVESL